MKIANAQMEHDAHTVLFFNPTRRFILHRLTIHPVIIPHLLSAALLLDLTPKHCMSRPNTMPVTTTSLPSLTSPSRREPSQAPNPQNHAPRKEVAFLSYHPSMARREVSITNPQSRSHDRSNTPRKQALKMRICSASYLPPGRMPRTAV